MFFENVKLALNSMRGSKMRTILSLLGIIIGVGSVVAILTLGESATKSITESLVSSGLETISITPMGGAKQFNEQFGNVLEQNVADIKSVLPVNSSGTRIRSGKEIQSTTLYGVPSNYADVLDYTCAQGSWFSAKDSIYKRQVVVLGASVAEDLFPNGDAVGSYVSIFRNQSKRYLVIGVMEEKDATLGSSFNDNVYIPYNTFTQRFRRVETVGSYVVRIADGADATKVGDDITAFLDSYIGEDYYFLISAASLATMAESITGTFSTFLAAIAGISLLVGGIGIMNIMLVSVAERTKEIGIRKALGASPRVIKGQFLIEAITLTSMGGLIGILLGNGLGKIVTNIAGWTFHLSVSACLLSIGFSMLIGVFFGLYPAAKAAKLDPIDALNYE